MKSEFYQSLDFTRSVRNKMVNFKYYKELYRTIGIHYRSVNENYDPTVLADFESHFNQTVPENAPYYKHTIEGPDDMPAHLKSAILGSSVSIPITKGKLNLGTWQGIYLCEHRNRGGQRKLLMTIQGE